METTSVIAGQAVNYHDSQLRFQLLKSVEHFAMETGHTCDTSGVLITR